MSISEAFELYAEDYIRFRNQSAKTEYNHRTGINQFIKYASDLEVTQITKQHLIDWKKELEKRCVPRTVAGYIVTIRVLFGWLQIKGYDVLSPDEIPVPLVDPPAPKFITPEEVSELIYLVGLPCRGYPLINRIRNQLVISFLYGSGLRASELCKLNKGDIKYDQFTMIGKHHSRRLCFIDDRTNQLLDKYMQMRGDDNNPALIINNQTNTRLSQSVIQSIMTRVSTLTKKDVTAHVLRHSYATNLLRNKTDTRYIQVLMGHKSLQTTQIYTHVVDPELEKIYRGGHTI